MPHYTHYRIWVRSNYLCMSAQQWKYHLTNVNIVKIEAFYLEYEWFNKLSTFKYVSTVIGHFCAYKNILFTGLFMSQSEQSRLKERLATFITQANAYRWQVNRDFGNNVSIGGLLEVGQWFGRGVDSRWNLWLYMYVCFWTSSSLYGDGCLHHPYWPYVKHFPYANVHIKHQHCQCGIH